MSHIIDVLLEIAPIKNFTYWPSETATGDELSTPPIVWWKFKESSEELARSLQRIIEAYQGEIAWEFLTSVRPGQNWILMPARIREHARMYGFNGDLTAAADLRIKEPDFCKSANADLRILAEHILCNWRKL